MTTSHIIRLILLLVLSGISNHILKAQTGLPSGQVEVVKSFEARLAETDKIPINAPQPTSTKEKKSYDYLVIQSEPSLNYVTPEIRPLAMPSEKLPGTYNGFLKGGFGFPVSPYAEGSYFYENSQFNLLGHLKHHSANDKNLPNQRFMDNDFLLKGNYYFDQGFALGAHVNYSLDDFYFYGIEEGVDTTFAPQYARRRFNTLDGGVQFYNTSQNGNDLNYWAKFDFYNHKDDLGGTENGQLIHLGIQKYIGGSHPIFAEIISDLSNYKEEELNYKLNNFFFIPGAAYHGDNFQLRGAVRIAAHNDEFSFFPDIKASLLLMNGAFNLMAGWDGNFYKNNFRNLTAYNPFISPGLDPLRNASYLDYYGGVYGMLDNLQYELKGGYKQMNDMALFVPNFEVPTQFLIVYDSVSTIYAKANVQATFIDQITVGLTVGYNNFTTLNQEKAWHIPTLESNLNVVYRSIDKKFRLNGDIFYMNGIVFPDANGEAQNLNTLFDVSLGADYMFNNNFGVFAQLNNLAGNRWRRWYNYPTFGLNVLGGIIVRF